MKKKILIWVDDERQVPEYIKMAYDENNIIICRTYRQTIKILNQVINEELNGNIYIDLDHDIQCNQTGYDIAKYIVENNIPLAGFFCHSMNAVGKKNIRQLLSHYGYKEEL
jgi:hypothetical protein